VSGGRIIAGIGVGWNEQEFDIVGEDFHTRGKRTDEIVDILRMLWTQDTIEYHGTHYDFPPVQFEPKPKRPIPLIGGGMTPPAIRRMAGLDGCWIPVNDIPTITRVLSEVRKLREEKGIADQPYEVNVHAPLPLTKSSLDELEQLGVDRVVCIIGTPPSAGGPEVTSGSIPAASAGTVDSSVEALCENLERIAERAFA
jgi:alkanesulfonate monooxygenase SsuD/methylene tetrahydromethanopterin reductase-like flavin-dependent oxidoreductase (luciferase family)